MTKFKTNAITQYFGGNIRKFQFREPLKRNMKSDKKKSYELFFFALQEEGWKLNRNHYYQEGWLSTANLRGVVGVTYTTSHCGIDGSTQLVPPSRTNYNLRGHRAEVGNLKKNFLGLRTVSSVSKAEKN